MSIQYIRDTYDVPAKRGMRVTYEPHAQGKPTRHGRITGASGPYVAVRFDGESRSVRIHPTDDRLIYLPGRAITDGGTSR